MADVSDLMYLNVVKTVCADVSSEALTGVGSGFEGVDRRLHRGAAPEASGGSVKIGDALRILRVRRGLPQKRAGALEGAPDWRTLSHWETGRKTPSFPLLSTYLEVLGFNFIDLEEAIQQANGGSPTRLRDEIEALRKVQAEQEERLAEYEERLRRLESRPGMMVSAG